MHWEWKNCPSAWKGLYTTGFKSKHPTIVLEAVADYRLWIWYAYFGVAGSKNDINVLQSSPLFNDQELGVGPAVSFVANGNQHNMGCYLADGIYPMWPVFVKMIRCATEDKKKYFASCQEAVHKDVEQAFGVLQSRWAIVKGPSRLWHMDCIADVIYARIIMHNMIVEDEGAALTDWASDDDEVCRENAISRKKELIARRRKATEKRLILVFELNCVEIVVDRWNLVEFVWSEMGNVEFMSRGSRFGN
ncbi:uncharacterized protein LOC125221125 [Salvia hispanica]|uniref:uncharacterized protein LOC125221125 n=1 Tax=Salvia hispanica TaxID=49212 RepID=UPI002008F979|nr:uncharacterized protein LOC125221125 [Salvia hispanica]